MNSTLTSRCIRFTTIAIATVMLSHCGNSTTTSTNFPEQPASDTAAQDEVQSKFERKYHYVLANCDTFAKKFVAESQEQVDFDYCQSLVDDDANNNCAREQRHQQFVSDCHEVAPLLNLTISSDGVITPVETVDPTTRLLLLNQDSSTIENQLIDLWVEQATTIELDPAWLDKNAAPASSSNSQDDTANNLEIEEINERVTTDVAAIVADAQNCRLKFSGPACPAYNNFGASGYRVGKGSDFISSPPR